MLAVSIRKALPGFTLDVGWAASEPIVALVGPSGSGKTLNAAGAGRSGATRRRPDRARRPPALRHRHRRRCAGPERRVGYVFQGYALFPHLTVVQNVGYGLHARPRHERGRRVAEVLERLELTALGQRYPSELSGGQQQRVALGRWNCSACSCISGGCRA